MATSQAHRKFRAIISTGVKGNSLLMAGNEITTVVTLSLIIFSIVMVGCATKPSMNQFPELEARQPPKVKLGQELILLENPPMLSTGLIGTDGSAHLFFIDEDKRLNHLKILGDGIITREFLGMIETAESWTALDAVEHPKGSLRVLAGDRQYFRKAPNLKWREIKGNRCARFVPVDDNLFCAFVIKGEEIDAPERTDYTVGWFLLLPIFLWSDKHVSKLVLAQESQDGWIIRAVLDPDTSWDANTDFMVGRDSLGNLYFLYFTSKGGGYFIVFAYGLSGGIESGSTAPDSKLRFAKLKIDQLLTHSGNAQNLAKNQDKNPMQWIKIRLIPCPTSLLYNLI